MNFSDETLMAYVDGELDDEVRAQVAAAIATDAEVAQRIARHEALNLSIRTAYAGVLDEPVPAEFVRTARTAASGGRGNNVSDLADARVARSAKPQAERPRRVLREWGAIAASLIVGLILGQRFLGSGDAEPFATQAGDLLARGVLAQALSSELASAPTPGASTRIGISFRARSGEYCRTFALGGNEARDHALAGLACREHGRWRIDALAPSVTGMTAGYRMAGAALPKAVLQAMDEQIAGEPLDARGEAAARQHEWQ